MSAANSETRSTLAACLLRPNKRLKSDIAVLCAKRPPHLFHTALSRRVQRHLVENAHPCYGLDS
jgi:hypothetical protein